MNKLYYLFFALFFLKTQLYAQQGTYGNEWIDFSKKYIKIKVSGENIYHLTYSDILNSGITPGNNINPKYFQLFNKGREMPLLITGAEDNSFDNQDRLYFYGCPNNADLDKRMYSDIKHIPNVNVSLYEDENYYFLTYNPSITGLRYSIPSVPATPVNINYVITKSRLDFKNTYYQGAPILDVMSLSEFIEGEGYMSNLIGDQQTVNYNLNTTGFFNTSEIAPVLNYYVAGRSDAESTSSRNHHFQLKVDNIITNDTTFKGYQTISATKKLISIGETTNLSFSIISDLGAKTDYQAISYFEIIYPRSLSLNNQTALNFQVHPSYPFANVSFTNSNIVNPILLDKNNSYVYNVSKQATSLSINNISNLSNSDFYLYDLNNSINITFEKISFRSFNTSDIKSTVIISNKLLASGAEKYQQYNQTSRNLPTLLAYTDDIYNEFFYGFHHPLAISNFVKWCTDKSPNTVKSTLLLGKGLAIPKGNLSFDLVPTYGYPASDNLLTTYNGAKSAVIALGRIPAKTNEEIESYLEKLKIYVNLSNSIWRKKILNITGGGTLSEYQSFTNYMRNLSDVAKNGAIGAFTSNFDKTVSEAVTENLTESIITNTNNGASLISFLGHGSATLTAVSLGTPNTLNNADKPINYLINGCSTGNAFSINSAPSYAENMILSRKGAISWIGTTSEGVASYLYSFSDKFYKHWFVNNYNKPISEGFRLGLNDQTNLTDKLSLAHSRQYIFFGDPNITFFNPEKSDFHIDNQKIFTSNPNQNALDDNFQFNILIQNQGKYIKDSLEVKITRKVIEQNIEQSILFNIKPIANSDTIFIKLSNFGLKVTGTNQIKVELDPNNKFDESNKLNNVAISEFFVPGNGVNALYPLKNSIIHSEVILSAEPHNLFTKNERYIFEIDTSSAFDSPLKKRSPTIISDIFPSWKPNINFENDKVYFWRVSLDNTNYQWSNSSFTYSNQHIDGQNVGHFEQLKSSNYKIKNIVLNKNEDNFKFEKDLFSTTIMARGEDVPIAIHDRRIRTNPLNSVGYLPDNIEGITMVSYSKSKKDGIITYPSPHNFPVGPFPINGYTGQFYWNTNDPIQLDSLVHYINNLPSGAYVLGLTYNNCSLRNLPIYVQDALKSIGLKEFTKIDFGEPYAFWGIKGTVTGSALEYTADYSSTIRAREQYFSYSHDLEYWINNGYIITDKFGPAKKWEYAKISFNNRDSDSQKIDIYGIDKNNNESKLFSDLDNGGDIDLAGVFAEQYPYIKFKINLKNEEKNGLPELKSWRVKFEPTSELSFDPPYLNNFYSEKIVQGDSLNIKVGISNISPIHSDSLDIEFKITSKTSIYSKNITTRPIGAYKSDTLSYKLPTSSLKGTNNLLITLKNRTFIDNYNFNNQISYNFDVVEDNKAPNLEILADGKRILNGEIISPIPIFTISVTDENKFALQNDTSLVEVYLKSNVDNNYKRYFYSTGDLKISSTETDGGNRLMLSYIPGKLLDGKYTLKIISQDKFGNRQKNDGYLDFEVINASTISSFYPYPNPVVDKMKFVFTLTGEKIPEKIKIQILNTSGKVVREILKEELGNIKIGNNISNFTWDGTDMFGDRLAKGVYFYKIYIQDSSLDFKHRFTKGDAYFKNNIGKIYLIK